MVVEQEDMVEVEEEQVHDAGDPPAAVDPPSLPPSKDDFQEELVLRPLHSGDIYASFQFRTVWDADFMGDQKGTEGVMDLCWAFLCSSESFINKGTDYLLETTSTTADHRTV